MVQRYEREVTKEDLLEYIKQQPRRYKEIRHFMTDHIEGSNLEPVSHAKFIKCKLELEKEGKIYNQNGTYSGDIPKFKIESDSGRLEELETLTSPFLGDVKLFILHDYTSFGMIRTESYISTNYNLSIKLK